MRAVKIYDVRPLDLAPLKTCPTSCVAGGEAMFEAVRSEF